MTPFEPDEGMDHRPYITLAYDFFDHPKTLALGDPETAKDTLLRLWTYCNQYKTDGKVPKNVVKKFKKRHVDKLLKVGYLAHTEDPEVFECRDYLKHQKSRAQLERLQAAKVTNGTKGAHKRWHVDRNIADPDCLHCIG